MASLTERKIPECTLSPMGGPRRRPPASQQVSPRQEPTCLSPSSWTSSLWDCGEIFCLSPQSAVFGYDRLGCLRQWFCIVFSLFLSLGLWSLWDCGILPVPPRMVGLAHSWLVWKSVSFVCGKPLKSRHGTCLSLSPSLSVNLVHMKMPGCRLLPQLIFKP